MLLSLQFLRLIFTCPLREKKRSPRQTGIFISPADKKKRNNSEENASSSDIVLEALNMAESVTALLDRILKTTVDTLIDVRNETSKHRVLKSVK